MSAVQWSGKLVGVLIVTGGDVFVDGDFVRADVVVDDGSIVAIGGPGDRRRDVEIVDAAGCLVVPGLVDLQCNGAAGIDVSVSPERLPELSRHLAGRGTTSFVPTVITGPTEIRRAVAAVVIERRSWPGAVPLGVHLEGPLINPVRRGAHPMEHITTVARTDTSWWAEENGVLLVTLAPEIDGATRLIAELSSRGVTVSIGHSDGSRADVRAAVDAGASLVTHLFNAMSPLGHREPGVVGTALIDDRLAVGLIADGVHVDPDIVGLAWRHLGPERCVLVSDSVAGAGVSDVDAARTPDGTLAGSHLTLVEAVRNLVAMTGCSPAAAIRCATTNPADVIGRKDLGRLRPGARADLVVLSPALDVERVMVSGRFVC